MAPFLMRCVIKLTPLLPWPGRAGTLSKELGTPHNTLSFHLNHLSNAGVVKSRQEGRSIIYRADFEVIGSLIGFMIEDCCSAEVAHIHKHRKKGCSVIELADFCSSPKNAPRARR
jgi:ArsR family transcriptional regulator